jgi:hypothetical protein
VVAAGLLLVLAGCATAPQREEVPLYRYLPPDQMAYFAVNVVDNQDAFLYLAGELEVDGATVIRRVDRIAGSIAPVGEATAARAGRPAREAVSGDAESRPSFVVVASGNLPSGATRFALWRERQFQRTTGMIGEERIIYFQEREGVLQIAPFRDDLVVVTDGSLLSHL